MRVLPLPASSSPDPQAEAESARDEQTAVATRARRNPVLDIGGPPRTGAVGAAPGPVGAAHSSTGDSRAQDVTQNLELFDRGLAAARICCASDLGRLRCRAADHQ